MSVRGSDARTRRILDRAAKTAYRTSRAIGFQESVSGRSFRLYPDRRWINLFAEITPATPTGSMDLTWLRTDGGFRDLDARIEAESASVSSAAGMMGTRGTSMDLTKRNIGAAALWGLLPDTAAVYLTYNGGHDYRVCHRATFKVPENNAFWSIAVYGNTAS